MHGSGPSDGTGWSRVEHCIGGGGSGGRGGSGRGAGRGAEVRVTLGRTKLEGAGTSITGCKLGRRLGCRPSPCESRKSPCRRPASSAEHGADGRNTPPIVGCGESFDLELRGSVAKDVFVSLLFSLSARLAGDSLSLCFGVQMRPDLNRNHINKPPTMRTKRVVAASSPVISASEICKISPWGVIKYMGHTFIRK